MKYVSIDLETTGLNPEKHQIIEFAAVIADTENPKPPEQMPYCRLLNRHPNMDELPLGPYCAKLHYKLWEEFIADMKTDPVNTTFHSQNLKGSIWIHNLAEEFRAWLNKHNVDKTINPAGKNFSGFDRQFLARIPNAKCLRFRHRTFDPAGFFFRYTDAELPDTDTCLKRAGLEKQTDHTALADARNVVALCQVAFAKQVCEVPPPNWECTRKPGHEGPCAAVRSKDHDCSIHDSALMCNHANEMPAQCPCDATCYCKYHSCRNRP